MFIPIRTASFIWGAAYLKHSCKQSICWRQYSTSLLDVGYPNLQVHQTDPPIYTIDKFIEQEECSHIKALAQQSEDRVDISRTYLSSSMNTTSKLTANSIRNSTTFFVNPEQIADVFRKISLLTGFPAANFEEPQVVRYRKGQHYGWHQDAIPAHRVNRQVGNRVATVLIYLNTLPESTTKSGYTTFRELELSVRPEAGKCLIFSPCFADGTPDARTVHCSNSIDGDGVEKWALQIWIHQRPYLW